MEQNQDTPSSEQAADLAALQAQAVDGGAPGSAAPATAGDVAGAKHIPSPTEEAADLIKFAVTLFGPIYPSVARIYTDEKQLRLADVSGPLMAKYGLTVGGIFEKWGPEINFAIVAIPLAMETARGIQQDVKDSQPKKTPEPEGQPGADQ